MATATFVHETPAPSRLQALDSAAHPEARRLADVLRSRSDRPRVFILDDEENIAQAAAHGIVLEGLYAMSSVDSGIRDSLICAHPDVPFLVIDDAVARSVFGDERRSRVFALARAPRPARLAELRGRVGDIVVLDGVRLVGNIGAVARTACAFGAAGVVLVDSGLRTVLDRRLIRASRGLVFAMPIVLAARAQVAEFLRQERFPVASLSADAPAELDAIRAVPDRLALVFGGERGGVSAEMDALAVHRFAIPMASNVESLNVSVTAAVALYEHRKAFGG